MSHVRSTESRDAGIDRVQVLRPKSLDSGFTASVDRELEAANVDPCKEAMVMDALLV